MKVIEHPKSSSSETDDNFELNPEFMLNEQLDEIQEEISEPYDPLRHRLNNSAGVYHFSDESESESREFDPKMSPGPIEFEYSDSS